MIVILNASHLLITLFYFTWLVTKQHFISLESLTKLCDGLDAFNENDEAVCIKQLLIIRTLSRTDIFKIFELSHSKKEKLNIIFFFNTSFIDSSNFHWEYLNFIISIPIALFHLYFFRQHLTLLKTFGCFDRNYSWETCDLLSGKCWNCFVAMEVMKFRFKKCLLFSWRALIKNFVKITWHYCLNQKSYRW